MTTHCKVPWRQFWEQILASVRSDSPTCAALRIRCASTRAKRPTGHSYCFGSLNRGTFYRDAKLSSPLQAKNFHSRSRCR
jgi:hypothetical protein